MPRLLGKAPAVEDNRMASLRLVVKPGMLPPVQRWTNWRANIPVTGVDMLGNDVAGLCVLATAFHYLELASRYTLDTVNIVPTTTECVAAYSAITGYDPQKPETDQGTYVQGPSGLFQYWTRHGLMCGGELNKLTSGVTIDFTNEDDLKQALTLGPVFLGATLTESDIESPFMFEDHVGDVVGGHEMLMVGYETLLSGRTYYDIMTWDGLWRCTGDWLAVAADECAMIFDQAFFNDAGIDPAGIDYATVAARMKAIVA